MGIVAMDRPDIVKVRDLMTDKVSVGCIPAGGDYSSTLLK